MEAFADHQRLFEGCSAVLGVLSDVMGHEPDELVGGAGAAVDAGAAVVAAHPGRVGFGGRDGAGGVDEAEGCPAAVHEQHGDVRVAPPAPQQTPGQRFTVWSAGCSSGEEPYTLAIVLSEFARRSPGFQFTIMATDISTKVLDKARDGVYDEGQIAMIPYELKQKYFMRSKDRDKKLVRVAPALRSVIQFQRINLMDQRFPIPELSLDALFCRNVMIYFDRETQNKLLGKFCRYLKTGEYLFLGHSETVHGFDLPLVRIASTIDRKMP